MKRRSWIFTAIIVIGVLTITGCTSEKDNTLAHISSNANSEYENTFRELNLGVLFDFNLKLTKADESWVNMWVEGYRNGKPVEPFPLVELSYGLSPKQLEKGRAGFGIINPNGDDPKLFLYSIGVSQQPKSIDNNLFNNTSNSTWSYTIGSETIGLEDGEEKILAVYRQDENDLRVSYDYQDQDSINEMINEDKTALLLKIKVEKREEVYPSNNSNSTSTAGGVTGP